MKWVAWRVVEAVVFTTARILPGQSGRSVRRFGYELRMYRKTKQAGG